MGGPFGNGPQSVGHSNLKICVGDVRVCEQI